MDGDTQAIAIGLGAGLGGFALLLIFCCVCWNIFCGSCIEKKSDQLMPISINKQNQRRPAPSAKPQPKVSTITNAKTTNIYSDIKSSSSMDLASRMKAAHH